MRVAEQTAKGIVISLQGRFGTWNTVLAHTLAAGESGRLSFEERRRKLVLVAEIENELDTGLINLDARLTAAAPEIAASGRIVDLRNAADRMRDLLVRTRVALRAPDRD
jgi:hypothetical protein